MRPERGRHPAGQWQALGWVLASWLPIQGSGPCLPFPKPCRAALTKAQDLMWSTGCSLTLAQGLRLACVFCPLSGETPFQMEVTANARAPRFRCEVKKQPRLPTVWTGWENCVSFICRPEISDAEDLTTQGHSPWRKEISKPCVCDDHNFECYLYQHKTNISKKINIKHRAGCICALE